MKWMIASDIHGSEYYCNELLEAYRSFLYNSNIGNSKKEG